MCIPMVETYRLIYFFLATDLHLVAFLFAAGFDDHLYSLASQSFEVGEDFIELCTPRHEER